MKDVIAVLFMVASAVEFGVWQGNFAAGMFILTFLAFAASVIIMCCGEKK